MMAATAWTDGCEPTWAVERSYKAGREVYRMLGASDNLRIKYRPGQHHGYLDVDSYFDWFNVAGNVTGFTTEMFPEALIQDFNWPQCKNTSSSLLQVCMIYAATDCVVYYFRGATDPCRESAASRRRHAEGKDPMGTRRPTGYDSLSGWPLWRAV
jgi:hypothetical protein